MRVLVTGGTGYLGRAIVDALARRGHTPVVFARRATDTPGSGEAIDGDIRDGAAVARAAEGCDAICHTAALVSIWRRRAADFDDVNVGGLRHILQAAEHHRVPRVVYTSSFLALPPAGRAAPLVANDYQRTKADAERVADAAARRGVPIIRLYPGVIYGPGRDTEGNLIARLVRDHLAGRLPGIVGADRPWSYAWIEDVAEAHVTAIERAEPGTSYVLGGDNVPQMRVFEVVREIAGRPLPRRIPFALASALGALEEVRARVAGGPPLLTRSTVAIFREDWSLDSSRAIRDLGYRVRPVREGVAALLASL